MFLDKEVPVKFWTSSRFGRWIKTQDPHHIRLGGGLCCPSDPVYGDSHDDRGTSVDTSRFLAKNLSENIRIAVEHVLI